MLTQNYKTIVIDKAPKNNSGNITVWLVISVLTILVLLIFGDNIVKNVPSNKELINKLSSGDMSVSYFAPKFDEEKYWIYNAKYKKDVNTGSYSTSADTYYVKDIVVPHINIKSTYGFKANQEIKNIFDDAIKHYNEGVKDKITYVDECNYEYYFIDRKILSVILTYGIGGTDVVQTQYYTFNIDLRTGDEVSYEEACKIAGIDFSSINSKARDAITNVMNEKMKDLKYPDNYPVGTNFDTYNNESINNYNNSVEDNSIKYFLDNNNKLNIVVKLSVPVGTGEINTIITVE